MNVEKTLNQLQQENDQLKKDKQNMLKVIQQMNVTLSQLINRYIANTENKGEAVQ